MPKGGARARSGPAPSPTSLRQKDGDWIRLPAAGRTSPAPEWPLTDPTDREADLWAREWRRPQALVWEANGQEIEVALYIRSLAEAEAPGAAATLRTLVRQLQEALGLTVPGLARNRWTIDAEIPVAASSSSAPAPRRASSRSRLKVVEAPAPD